MEEIQQSKLIETQQVNPCNLHEHVRYQVIPRDFIQQDVVLKICKH